MPNRQEPTARKSNKNAKNDRSPSAPGYDKKLDGPNRPST